jgi:hypothetical protein
MAEMQDDELEMQASAPDANRSRRVALVAVIALAMGIGLGVVGTLLLRPDTTNVVAVATGDEPALPVSDIGEPDGSTPPDDGTTVPAPNVAAPPRQQQHGRLVAVLAAEPSWAPTDHFAATITLDELEDGSWSAQVVAEGLQPAQRHGAGVTWDSPFFSSFCIGMSDDAGRWTCTGRIDRQYVTPDAVLKFADFGDASGRIWAHGTFSAG